MIFFYLRTIPRSSDVVLELVGVNEDQWTQEGDKYNEREVKNSKERIYLCNEEAQHQTADKCKHIINDTKSMSDQVTEDWDEPKDAEAHVKEAEHLGSLLQARGQQNTREKDGINGSRVAEVHCTFNGVCLLLPDLFLGCCACTCSLQHLGRWRFWY